MEIRPGVAAVIRDDEGRVLLHRRRLDNGWAPPSGAVEPGETVLKALVREVHEETRLEIHVEGLIGIYSDPAMQVVHYPDRTVHFITSLFACRKSRGDLHGSDEGLVWSWFDPMNLPEGLLDYARTWLGDSLQAGSAVVVR